MDEPSFLVSRPNVTARAFVEYKGKFLLLFAPWCERWTLPGGRVEGAESVEQTIERELEEEIGIKPKDVRFVGFGQGAQYGKEIDCAPPKLHIMFHVIIQEEPTIDKEEASRSRWVTLEELRALTDTESGIDDFFRRFPEALR